MTWQELIEPALYQGTHTIADVERMIADGEAVLWLGDKSAAVTEIIVYPKLKVMHLWLCGGDMDEITDLMLPRAEKYAVERGCQRLTTGGRKGWDRVMSKHGFTPIASVCAKELQNVV